MKETSRKVKLMKPLDVEKINIIRDNYFPNAYLIDLPLDATPDHAWQYIFLREWKSSRHLWDRKLFLMGDKLRLVTTIDDIEDKLNWVKQVIERTNKSIDEYERAAHLEGQMEEQREVTENLELLRAVLRRSFRSF